MLDALKNIAGGKNKPVQKQTERARATDRDCARRARRDQRDADVADDAQRRSWRRSASRSSR